ncbi:MAG: cyclic nucleotide-binding domain-containing protein [Dehalococcoidia bacterium]
MNAQEALKKAALFSNLQKGALDRIASVTNERNYKAGDVIIKEGDRAVAFFVIVEGQVEVLRGDTPVAKFGPGDFFGEMALFEGYPRSSTVKAVTDTKCLVLTQWDFMAELRSEPTIAVEMLPIMARRLRAADERLEHQ